MLFASEGRGFFPSSASGYSKGLSLLLLREKNKDKGVEISTWNRYLLVDQELDSDLRPASFKNRISRGCASCICLGLASAEPESHSPLKEQTTFRARNHEFCIENSSKTPKSFGLKSSLKKRSVAVPDSAENADGENILGQRNRRKVRWTDTCGLSLLRSENLSPGMDAFVFEGRIIEVGLKSEKWVNAAIMSDQFTVIREWIMYCHECDTNIDRDNISILGCWGIKI